MKKPDENSKLLKLRPRRQLTLPRDICEQLGLKIGDRLSITVEGDRLVARPARNVALEALQEIRRLFQESGITEEELQESGREIRKQLSRSRYGQKS